MDSHYIRIKHWEKLYENSRSRRIERLTWVPIPNKHDGLGLARMMNEKDGFEIFACWILLLQVASKCKPRGSLIDDEGCPLDSFSIIIKVGAAKNKEKVMERAISFILQLRWIERVIYKPDPELSLEYHPSAPELNRIEGNRIESDTNVSESSDSKPLSPSKRITFNGSELKGMIDEDFKRWAEAYPACDIKAEIASALDWLISNPLKAKKSNYARFLTAWFKRSQDRGGSLRSNKTIRPAKTGYIPAPQGHGNDYGSKAIKGS